MSTPINRKTELQDLVTERRSDALSLASAATHFAVVYVAVYYAAWNGPGWSTVFCWLWFGILGHGFHQLLHECAHRLTFRNSRWNEGLAHWVVAPLYLADFDAFRSRHFMHHRDLGHDGDPKYTYRTDVRGLLFARLLVSMLTMAGAVRKAFLQVGEKSGATSETTGRALMRIAIVQPIFALTVLGAARLGHPNDWSATLWAAGVAYFFVYLYGVAALTVMVATLRAIAEHRATGADEPIEGSAALRNFTHRTFDWLVFGTYGFTDHATHHRFPSVPSYRLPAITERLAASDPDMVPVGTHVNVLARLVAGYRPPAATGASLSSAES